MDLEKYMNKKRQRRLPFLLSKNLMKVCFSANFSMNKTCIIYLYFNKYLPKELKMNYSEYNIVFQEIPTEISLVFTITGCQLKCPGCHSSYLWDKNKGKLLTKELFLELLNRYKGYVTCVLFMGGEWHKEQLINFLIEAKECGFKTALYTGLDKEEIHEDLLMQLDYVKTGKWIKELGGLDSTNTNQRLIDLSKNKILNHLFIK